MLDEPQKNNQYGSVIAAPVVGNILADILPYLGFEPTTPRSSSPRLIWQHPI